MDVDHGRDAGVALRSVTRVTCALLLPALLLACKNDTVAEEAPRGFQEISSQCAPTAIADRFLVSWKDGSISVERARNADEFKKYILQPNEDEIAFAEHDQVIRLDRSPMETETFAAAESWGQEIIEAPGAWARGVQGQGVTVAVIDSGVDVTHPQLRAQLAINTAEQENGIDDDGNGLIDDISGYDFHDNSPQVRDGSGHGTHVAGIIVAEHGVPDMSGAPQVVGVAPGARLLPLDFMTDNGAGSIGNAIRAIHYAVSQGAKVINASWGGGECSATLQRTIQDLEAKGVLMVVAAGNMGVNLDWNPEFPAAFTSNSQITVGATSARDIMAGFSNYSYSLVHLAAPGVNIVSTLPGGRRGQLSGTSMAAPFVSAAAALLWSFRPQATVSQVRQALFQSVDRDPSHPNGVLAVRTGGRLNVRKAIDTLATQLPE